MMKTLPAEGVPFFALCVDRNFVSMKISQEIRDVAEAEKG
jgi:hypothetical protein